MRGHVPILPILGQHWRMHAQSLVDDAELLCAVFDTQTESRRLFSYFFPFFLNSSGAFTIVEIKVVSWLIVYSFLHFFRHSHLNVTIEIYLIALIATILVVLLNWFMKTKIYQNIFRGLMRGHVPILPILGQHWRMHAQSLVDDAELLCAVFDTQTESRRLFSYFFSFF
jgi:hypothetical protein